MLVIRPIN